MFEDSTFDSRCVLADRTPRRMAAAIGINGGILAALLVLPLLYPESLPGHLLRDVLYVPPAPTAPALVRAKAVETSATERVSLRNPWEAPRKTPANTDTTAEPAPETGDLSSSLRGMQGMEATGAPAASTTLFRAEPRQVVTPGAPKVLKISGGVAEGRLMFHPAPLYPILAKATGTSGTVVLAATIDREGKIANLRAVSGPPLLREAATEAVAQWRYRPYMLNNQPVEVETTVTVVFSMSGR